MDQIITRSEGDHTLIIRDTGQIRHLSRLRHTRWTRTIQNTFAVLCARCNKEGVEKPTIVESEEATIAALLWTRHNGKLFCPECPPP